MGCGLGLLLLMYISRCSASPGPTGDNAEFQYLGYVFGISHPTGYPTYLMLNGIFTHLFPAGTLAWRANVLSAFFATGACAGVAAAARRLGASPRCALLAALSMGLTWTFFRLARVAEVYSLHALFVAWILYAFIRWDERAEDRWLYLGCGLLACSFGNHLTTVLLLPTLLLWIAWRAPRTFARPRVYAIVGLFVLLGAGQYAYLILRSSPDVLFTYTALHSGSDIVGYLTGAQFSEAKGGRDWESIISTGIHLVRELLPELAALGCLSLLGLVALWKSHRRVFVAFMIYAGCSKLFMLWYAIPDIADYALPLFVVLGVLSAVGLDRLLRDKKWLAAAITLPMLYGGYALAQPGLVDTESDRALSEFFTSSSPAGILVTRNWRDSNLARYYAYGTSSNPGALHVSEFAEAHFTPDWKSLVHRWQAEGHTVWVLPDPRLEDFLNAQAISFQRVGSSLLLLNAVSL